MDDIIKVENQFYILATTAAAEDRVRVLKHGETFAVFDRYGDIRPLGLGEEGIYHEGTRFLSRLELRLGNTRPLLLSSTVRDDNTLLAVDLTNPDEKVGDQVVVPRGTLHIFRSKFLWQAVCYERFKIKNHGLAPVKISLSLSFGSDFDDIFEVRGMSRPKKGRRLEDQVEKKSAVLVYQGLDGVIRRTRLECAPQPKEISRSYMNFVLSVNPKDETTIFLTASCESGNERRAPLSYDQAFEQAERAFHPPQNIEGVCSIDTSNVQFNDWLNRSVADLRMMVSETPHGPYPYAGVPWFSTVFGRDGIITALEFLWLDPSIAKGVLAYLAANQATEVIPEQDAEPGKILHETRKGEMAALGEVPFGRYYGSVDATPLFIMLAGAYYERTADRAFIESIWPNIERALEWIDDYGDMDRDGFVEYLKHSSNGLIHQGWKDSKDSIFHADGTLAEGPLALCEVQGYVYAAKQYAARLADLLEKTKTAAELWREADALEEQFEKTYWCPDLSTYALALDGKKRPCRVRTSNAGHCLFAGIASPEYARSAAETLAGEDSFSGWGIRTVSVGEVRYNPMSYHNGSVWPHDNALIAFGLAQYGFKDLATKVLTGLFDASQFLELRRMPELFCGFSRRPGEGPTLYPVACAPQSWSAAAIFFLLQACLGISIKAPVNQIHISHPVLPEFLREVRIKNLMVGESSVDLVFQRHEDDVGINILKKQGGVKILLVK
ncbi:MAG: amylo-alpha-1,6-glucosidase [Candidatus Binatia bacterium]